MTALHPRIILMLTLPPVLWAGNAVVGRLMVGSVPPLALNALRWSLAFVLLLPLAWRLWTRPRDLAARWRYLAPLSLVGVGSYNALQYMAVSTSTPINVTLIAASSPLFMLAIGALAYGEQPTRRQAAGAALSLLGVALVLSHGRPSTLLQLHLVPGDLLMLLATALWAVYSWMLARPPASMRAPERPAWSGAEFLLAQVGFGALWASAGAGAEHALTGQPVLWSGPVYAALAYVAIGPSIVAYFCWGAGVAAVGPAIAAFFANLTPVFAALMSAAMLGVGPQWYHIAAFGLIAAGIVVTSRAAPRRTP
ncbi:DMT family transporter [Rhizobacter sp. SG703]|uniref:DMT family transporter n=1 Tax=Rhizobacter sp. SG703 TaxID=2587140 RepID=UPI001447A15A|nr:DMT family transporter [Rhizobacter sp. SG703]NKI96798.1 drug/metabolite transporter (DMT)-like permease [Rhizobacter sp. SG703]